MGEADVAESFFLELIEVPYSGGKLATKSVVSIIIPFGFVGACMLSCAQTDQKGSLKRKESNSVSVSTKIIMNEN